MWVRDLTSSKGNIQIINSKWRVDKNLLKLSLSSSGGIIELIKPGRRFEIGN
jgi:hypothetical protein